jgi:hypothetical protein
MGFAGDAFFPGCPTTPAPPQSKPKIPGQGQAAALPLGAQARFARICNNWARCLVRFAAADLPVSRTLQGTTCTQYGHEVALAIPLGRSEHEKE